MLNFNIQVLIQLVIFAIVAIIISTLLLILALSFDLQFLLALVVGLVVGGLISFLIGMAIYFFTTGVTVWVSFALAFVICAVSVYVAIKRRKELFPSFSSELEKQELFKQAQIRNLLLDDSVLYDARILKLLKTGFIERPVELTTATMQAIYNMANNTISPDVQEKGKRSLETLALLKNEFASCLVVTDEVAANKDLPLVEQLLEIAKRRGIGIITCNYALANLAKQQDVLVFNILELANSMKPVIFVGQKLKVKITQTSKQPGEGVALLPDGGKVLVRNGDVLMGQEVTVLVKKVIETNAGLLIQAYLAET